MGTRQSIRPRLGGSAAIHYHVVSLSIHLPFPLINSTICSFIYLPSRTVNHPWLPSPSMRERRTPRSPPRPRPPGPRPRLELGIQGSIQEGSSQIPWGFLFSPRWLQSAQGPWKGTGPAPSPGAGLQAPLTPTLHLPSPASMGAPPARSPPGCALFPPAGKVSRDHRASRLPRFPLPGAN